MSGFLGVLANPAAGRDIRRLVAHATPTSDATKVSIVRRAVIGAVEGGATRIVYLPDAHHLCERATDGLDLDVELEPVGTAIEGDGGDTARAAAAMARLGVGALVVLGGDGTHRQVARGWRDAPVVAVSTGTNNVFPRWVEATSAGLAAGLVAAGTVAVGEAARAAKTVTLASHDDLALVDAVLVEGRFVGSRAVWEPDRLRTAVVAVAEPDTVGLSSLAGLLAPCGRDEPGGVVVELDPGARERARFPIGPGSFAEVGVADVRTLDEDEPVAVEGPGVLALDGERERVLGAGEGAKLTVRRDGPRVIDVAATLRVAAREGVFRWRPR